VLLALVLPGAAAADSPRDMLERYAASAARALPGYAPTPERGAGFYRATHGREWSCASCHTVDARGQGRHASTGKPISPLAPSANADRFTDPAKTEKWFRRNCSDVLGRECTAAEKADFLAWLLAGR
jgi:hypothetical protein